MASTINIVGRPGSRELAGDPRLFLPCPGLEARTVDTEGNAVEGAGELEVRAPWITGQYHSFPEPTSEWFATGDVAQVGPAGEFTMLGRAKEVIKSGGEQIWPAAIEDVLLHHPLVSEVAIIEIPHERWGGQPLACVVALEAVATSDLREYLLESLPKWQVPNAWAFLDSIPHTVVGKSDRRRLSRMFEDGEITLTTP